MLYAGKLLVEQQNVKAYGANRMFTEASFFKIFSLVFVQGDPNTALSDPLSVVITNEFVRKYFRNKEAFGKTIQIEKENFVVKRVL